MRHLVLLIAALTSIALADTPDKSVNLLTDKTLVDWEFVTATPTALDVVCKPGADGVVAVVGKPTGYLATKISYENYRFHCEWRWPADAAKTSNGGVLLHIAGGPAAGTPWPVSIQMQLKLGRAGDLLPMNTATFAEPLTSAPGAKPPQLERKGGTAEKPLGEWNICDIICRADSMEVTINGIPQNRITKCQPAAGKIGFQLEGNPFELRNVRISGLAL